MAHGGAPGRQEQQCGAAGLRLSIWGRPCWGRSEACSSARTLARACWGEGPCRPKRSRPGRPSMRLRPPASLPLHVAPAPQVPARLQLSSVRSLQGVAVSGRHGSHFAPIGEW